MTKLILTLLIFISLNGISQTVTKEDSALIMATNTYMDSISKKIPIYELKGWAYKNTSAERYDAFVAVYNAFLQEIGLFYYNSKKKKEK